MKRVVFGISAMAIGGLVVLSPFSSLANAYSKELKVEWFIQDSDNNYELVSAHLPSEFNFKDWFHVAGVYEYQNSLKLYVDKNLVAEKSVSIVPEFLPGHDAYIGCNACFTTNGIAIDEVRISDVARDSTDFQESQYTSDSYTVGLYHLNSDGSDSSGNGNDLTINTSCIDWITGKFDQAVYMNAPNPNALIAPGAGLTYPGNGDWTVEAWAKIVDTTQAVFIVVCHYSEGISAHDPYELRMFLVDPYVEEENTEGGYSRFLEIEPVLNPVSSNTDIHFSIARHGMFSLCLYDLTGRKLKTIDSGIKNAGEHQARFETEEFASGIYFLRLETEFGTAIKKIVMMK